MSSNIGKVRSIRIYVEPVEVELEEDDGIKWTSLQTAFPGCSGMYFRDREKDCRSSVKFDGQKFNPPGGAWNDRQYFVNLSQRCHSSNLSSYESATKTFEKNVQAVQQLIASTMGGSRKKAPISPTGKHSASSASIVSNLTVTSQEQERLLQSGNQAQPSIPLQSDIATKGMTPLEQQFADLAKISTGKDIVIENLRDEIKKLNDKMEDSHKSIRELDVRRSEAESKVSAYETELALLRSMASGQQSMNDKVELLTKTVSEKDQVIMEMRHTFEKENAKWKADNQKLEEKITTLRHELDAKCLALTETSENLEVALASKTILSVEIEQLRPLADAIQLENFEEATTYVQLKNELMNTKQKLEQSETENNELKQSFEASSTTERSLAIDNTKLLQKNTQLEDRMAHVDDEIKKINQQWKQTMDSTKKEWSKTRKEAETEVESMRKQISDLQRLLESSTRDAADNARRLQESNRHVEKLKKNLENSEYRQQEPLKRQIKTLSTDLNEAETRIMELTSLVSSLTADAHNSRRDIDDLI